MKALPQTTKSRKLDIHQDVESPLRDAPDRTNTELNKAKSERDRYKAAYEQLKEQASTYVDTIHELKAQLHAVVDQSENLRKQNDWYIDQHQQSKDNYETLKNNWASRYKSLELEYYALRAKIPKLETDYSAPALTYSDYSKSSQATSSTSSGGNLKTTTVSDFPDFTKRFIAMGKSHRDDEDRIRHRDEYSETHERREDNAKEERPSKRFVERERSPVSYQRREHTQRAHKVDNRIPETQEGPPSFQQELYQSQQVSEVKDKNPPKSSQPDSAYTTHFTAAYGYHDDDDDDDYEDQTYHAYPIQR